MKLNMWPLLSWDVMWWRLAAG